MNDLQLKKTISNLILIGSFIKSQDGAQWQLTAVGTVK